MRRSLLICVLSTLTFAIVAGCTTASQPPPETTDSAAPALVATSTPEPTSTPVPDPAADLPALFHRIGPPKTHDELTEAIAFYKELCKAQKTGVYTNIANDVYTLEETKAILQQSMTRHIKEDSDGLVILTDQEGKELILWIYQLCGITAEEAAAYEIPSGFVPDTAINSFPLRPEQYFSGFDDLEQEVVFWFTQCEALRQNAVLALDSGHTIESLTEVVANGMLLRTEHAPKAQALTPTEAHIFAQWFLAACEVQ